MSLTPAETPATVLLVDDEPSILSALRRLLRPAGYQLLLANSGEEGLALLAEHPVNLVVSDMRMPGMDGAQFLEKVRAQWPDTMRLLLTGYADIASTVDAINRGEIYRYIAKPWDDAELLLVIRHALQQQALKQENQRLLALTQQQNEALQALNADLAKQVAARTAELLQLNEFLNLANQQLRQQFLTSIKVFSSLLELRGGAVAGHARRVAEMARKLAVQMGLDERTQHDVFLAGLLHDIGKIGFSDSLLGKPVSVLNGREQAEYRRHAVLSERSLLPLHELKEVAAMVRVHHEQHDGRGFPDGLRGDDIPVGGRILALANDYDGMVMGTHSERRLTPDEACQLIRHASGHHYHPDVVGAFLSLWERGLWSADNDHLVPVSQLQPGSVLARDFLSRKGALLLAADQVLTPQLIQRLQTWRSDDGTELRLPIRHASARRMPA